MAPLLRRLRAVLEPPAPDCFDDVDWYFRHMEQRLFARLTRTLDEHAMPCANEASDLRSEVNNSE